MGNSLQKPAYDIENRGYIELGEHLPKRIKVTSSHPSLEQISITKETILDIYFIKSTSVAVLTSPKSKKYLLPLNSSTKFSPIYNPENNLDKALKGYSFKSIGQLLQASPRPAAISASTGYIYDGYDDIYSMNVDDIYVVKQSSSSDMLTCYDTLASKMVEFPCHLKCEITTNPYKFQLYPSNFFNELPLPTQVILQKFPPTKNLTILTATNITTMYSVIVSPDVLPSSPETYSTLVMFELALDLSVVDFEVIDLEDSEYQQLKEKATRLYSTFSSDQPKKITVCSKQYCCDELQQTLLKQRPGSDVSDEATNHYSLIPPQQPLSIGSRPDPVKSVIESEPLDSQHMPTQDVTQKLTDDDCSSSLSCDDLFIPLPAAPFNLESLTIATPNQSQDTTDDEDIYEPINPYYVNCKQYLKTDDSQNSSYTTFMSPLHRSTKDLNTVKERNTKLLSSYNKYDVGKLLDKLGISQYKKIFEAEGIDGSLLMDLDDEILQNDLGMNKKLHRIKLLRVIDGRQSVEEIL